MEASFDTILTQLGTGKWNILYYVTIWYWYAQIAFHILGGAFFAPEVDFTCRPPAYAQTAAVIVLPEDASTSGNISYSPENTHLATQAACSYHVLDNVTGDLTEEPCTEWDFDNSTFKSTFTSEFQLVCGKKYLQATYQSIYTFGILVGAGFNGFLADRFGRWTMIMIGTSIYTIITLGSCWLPTVFTILAARFLLGIMHPAAHQTAYILVMEVTEVKMRSAIGIVQFTTWNLGTMMYGGLAYAVRDWRWLQLMVSLPSLLVLPGLWFLDESPRWLIIRGQHERALRVLERAARWNKVTLPPKNELLNMMEEVQLKSVTSEGEAAKGTTMAKVRYWLTQAALLFRTPKLRLITISMFVDYFVVGIVFYGLALAASALNVNPFLYMTISGLAEVPSSTFLIPVVTYLGRRKSTIYSYLMCGVALLAQPLIPEDYKWLSITLVMIGKMASTSAYSVIFLYSTELYPTEIRTRGTSAATMFSQAGAMIAPFLMSALSSPYPWTITVVFGLASLVAAAATLPLPETLNKDLPDTMVDLEDKNANTSRKTEVRPEADGDHTTAC